MFVLEKVLRSLSEGNGNVNDTKARSSRNKNIPENENSITITLQSQLQPQSQSQSSISYFELLNKFDELKKDSKVIKSDSEYYDVRKRKKFM